MNIPAPGSSELIRETFILLALRLFLTQFLLGITYFSLIDWLKLAGDEVNFIRLFIFTSLQTLQIILSLYFFLRWFYRCYEINDKEVICHSGVFSRDSEYYSLERLESAKVKQGLWGMLLGFGTIRIYVHHNDNKEEVIIRNISHPRSYVRALEKTLKNHSN